MFYIYSTAYLLVLFD